MTGWGGVPGSSSGVLLVEEPRLFVVEAEDLLCDVTRVAHLRRPGYGELAGGLGCLLREQRDRDVGDAAEGATVVPAVVVDGAIDLHVERIDLRQCLPGCGARYRPRWG